MNLIEVLTQELSVHAKQVVAAIDLLDEGATVPFIARYRKEVTGELTDTQLRCLEERLHYFRELNERKAVIIASIASQEKLTDTLKKSIEANINKSHLEDLYLPFKPKRRTKAQIAREAGLAPLAQSVLDNPNQDPLALATSYLNADKGIDDSQMALEGARQVLMETFTEDAALIGQLRTILWDNGILTSKVIKSKEKESALEASKFKDYFDYQEPIIKIPSHRALALFRGQAHQVLRLKLTLSQAQEQDCKHLIAKTFAIAHQGRKADDWLFETVDWTWRVKCLSRLPIDCLVTLREKAEQDAIAVFASNLKDLLLAAPAGGQVTMGLDPGFRSGVKVVIVDQTSKLVKWTTIYPHAPQKHWEDSLNVLYELCRQYHVKIISIGNGTASRETEKLVADMNKQYPELKVAKVVVSEAGASVYSASALAAQEFPDLDVVYRGAVSIARRLQDPLAELVKIEPKAIGVGQYQHDLNQTLLAHSLDAVVEDCVNKVGVDVNMASGPLLSHISGLNMRLAENIVKYKDEHGAFKNRNAIKQVQGIGEKTFQQAAGFLRIVNGNNPLDASAVHPESYPVVSHIVDKQKTSLTQLMGNTALLSQLDAQQFTSDQFGLPTVVDIIQELNKPGRDPRGEFKTATFKEGIETIADLTPDLILEGCVTNVTHFGAFVDVGVHQDGLVHKSNMANRFVTDPRDIVKVGDIVTVKVLEIDEARQRISLSMSW